QVSLRAVVDHHVDRPEVEAEQSVQLTGTNRSIGLILGAGPPAPHHRPRAAPNPTRLPDTALLTSHITTGTCPRELARPGGHSEGPTTRSHPDPGRENPQRPWYCRNQRRKSRSPPGPPSPPTLSSPSSPLPPATGGDSD